MSSDNHRPNYVLVNNKENRFGVYHINNCHKDFLDYDIKINKENLELQLQYLSSLTQTSNMIDMINSSLKYDGNVQQLIDYKNYLSELLPRVQEHYKNLAVAYDDPLFSGNLTEKNYKSNLGLLNEKISKIQEMNDEEKKKILFMLYHSSRYNLIDQFMRKKPNDIPGFVVEYASIQSSNYFKYKNSLKILKSGGRQHTRAKSRSKSRSKSRAKSKSRIKK